ncbi:hypothetical protein Rs2_36217 [Raphanus sativus]|nr:hypothetical protein Rs2_36217 [Raphanus sativus]
MDPIASVVEKVKLFAKSSGDFLVSRHFGFHESPPSRQNPVSFLESASRLKSLSRGFVCWVGDDTMFRSLKLKRSVSITDKPEDEVGWGMGAGGVFIDGSRNHDRFQVESYLKFNIGHRFSLSPGLVYLTNSKGRTVGLMLQSHWSL